MKRITALFLAAALLLALAGCAAAPETVQTTVPTTQPVQTTLPPETTISTEPVGPRYELTVQRNVPLNELAQAEIKKSREPNLPDVESILIDDIPILLTIGESEGPMPICMFFHASGGSKEGYLTTARCYARDQKCIAVTIDGGAYGESPRGAMTDGETIAQIVEDVDKVLAFLSTLPGADLNRIYLRGGSLGGSVILTYLARGSFIPAHASADVPRADYTIAGPNTPLYSVHGANPRQTPHLTEEEVKALVSEYSPIAYAEHMMETELCVNVGLLDDADAVASCQALEETLKALGKENLEFNYYEAGHMLSGYVWHLADERFRQAITEKVQVENEIPTVIVHTISE